MEQVQNMPEWLSILPPLIAILTALIFREVLLALLVGILSGTLLIAFYSSGAPGLIEGLFQPIDLVLDSISPANGAKDHVSVIIFSLLIGVMANLITANGSMKNLVDRLAGRASSKK
jgi:Na+/H+ antiporter NhaC